MAFEWLNCCLLKLSQRLIPCVLVLQRMCATSSARPQCTTTFPSTGTASSSVCTLGTTARNTSATSSSPSSCRCADYTHSHWSVFLISLFFHSISPSLSLTVLCIYTQPCGVMFLGAAVGACTSGIRPEGQREEWRHHCHGLQWHYGHHQTPHAHTFCGGEPRLCECLCVHEELRTLRISRSDWLEDECYFQRTTALN